MLKSSLPCLRIILGMFRTFAAEESREVLF